MKVTFRKEVNLRVDMSRLMDECIDRLDWQQEEWNADTIHPIMKT